MSVLDRAALDESPLADLHTIASELSIDGYRRLRRAELIDAILDRQRGQAPTASARDDRAGDDDEERAAPRPRRGRRGGRARASEPDREGTPDPDTERDAKKPTGADERPGERRRAGAPGRSARAARAGEAAPDGADEVVDGTVELTANGSGFLRVSAPETTDDDVYISAAQVKRCELVTGDTISGPKRAPRRSERFPSLIKIDTINGRPADEVAEGARFDDLPAAFPDERLSLGSDDPTLKGIEALAPIGKGSRVTIVGGARAGKTEALQAFAAVLESQHELEVSLVLAGVRPEEISESAGGPLPPAAAVSFAASADVQGHAVERVIDQGRRIATRGVDAVVLIDTLDGLQPAAARKALAAARNLVDGGSLTVIATASRPFGGETTVIALDAGVAAAGRYPAIDPIASGTIRPEQLVGETGAKAIAKARAKAIG